MITWRNLLAFLLVDAAGLCLFAILKPWHWPLPPNYIAALALVLAFIAGMVSQKGQP